MKYSRLIFRLKSKWSEGRRSKLEAETIKKAQQGDLEAFSLIVQSFENRVYNQVLRLLQDPDDAKDITQEIFIKIFTHLKDFRGEAKFSTWVYSLSTNACLDWLRKVKKEREKANYKSIEAMDGLKQLSIDGGDPQEIIEQEELRQLINQAINTLPYKYRAVITLSSQEGLSYQEIAEVLGIPVQTVGTQIFRAKAVLRDKLKPLLGGGGWDAGKTPMSKNQKKSG